MMNIVYYIYIKLRRLGSVGDREVIILYRWLGKVFLIR